MDDTLSVLLVEDDVQACCDIENYVSTIEEVDLVAITNNSERAAQLVRETLPDAIILDLELHAGSGSGLTLLRSLQADSLKKRPYVVVTTHNSSAITYSAARDLGADYIFYKHQSGYSAKSVIDFLCMLKSVIHTQVRKSSTQEVLELSPAQKQRQLLRRVYAELDEVGISPKAVGYDYLAESIIIAAEYGATNLCSTIAHKHGKTASSVERAMQNAIARAWNTTPIDVLLANYTAKIRSNKGVPTLTEFVCFYAKRVNRQ